MLKLPGKITIHVPDACLHTDVWKDIPIVGSEEFLYSCLNSTEWSVVR